MSFIIMVRTVISCPQYSWQVLCADSHSAFDFFIVASPAQVSVSLLLTSFFRYEIESNTGFRTFLPTRGDGAITFSVRIPSSHRKTENPPKMAILVVHGIGFGILSYWTMTRELLSEAPGDSRMLC